MLEHYIIVSIVLFVCGLTGAVARRNIFISFLGVLMMLAAANIATLAFARWTLLPAGNIASFFIASLFCLVAVFGLTFFASYLKKGQSIYIKG